MVDGLQKQYQGKVDFIRYNTDSSAEGQALAQKFNLQYIPSFLFVNPDGTVVQQKVGGMTKDELKLALDALK